MATLSSSSLAEFDRQIFAVIERASPSQFIDLSVLVAAVPGRTRAEVSNTLARLKTRGLIGELSGRRFFAPLIVEERPTYFEPLTENEWPQTPGY